MYGQRQRNVARIHSNRNNGILLDMKPLQTEYLKLADMIEDIVEYLETHRIGHKNYMYANITSEKINNMLQVVLDSIHSHR